MHSQLSIHFSAGSCSGTLQVADELAWAGERDLHRWIDDAIAAGCNQLEVDCRHVTQVERSSLAVLSAAKLRLEAQGGSLLVTHPSPAFASTAQQAGFRALMHSAPTPAPNGVRRSKQQSR